jgi:signal transduction histidine kinase
MQLAQNASEHTVDGDRVALGSSIENGMARLWVSDSGRGIPKEDQEQIFRRFARSRDGHQSSAPGAGLGLAIVRAIAEAHHGTVDLRSAPGQGSTFTLVVPVDQPVPEPTER